MTYAWKSKRTYSSVAWPRPWDSRGVLLGWGGARIKVHMWTCTWSRCYAVAVAWGMYSWVGARVGCDYNVTGSLTHTSCYAITFAWISTQTSCYTTVRSLGLPRIPHATLRTFSWTSTHTFNIVQLYNWSTWVDTDYKLTIPVGPSPR